MVEFSIAAHLPQGDFTMTNEELLREKLRALCLLANEAFGLLAPEPHAPALTLAWDSELKKMTLRIYRRAFPAALQLGKLWIASGKETFARRKTMS